MLEASNSQTLNAREGFAKRDLEVFGSKKARGHPINQTSRRLTALYNSALWGGVIYVTLPTGMAELRQKYKKVV